MPNATFATCSFPEYRSEMGGVPVRISNGFPRYTLKYGLTHKLPMLYPDKATMTWEQARFAEVYFRNLATAGVDAIRQAADAVRVQANVPGDTPLVLLCFEQLTKKPWCHRTMFAAWWTKATGEEVPELGALPMREIRSQEGLF